MANDDDYMLVFCRSYWNKKARKRLYASHYGLEAFCFRIPVDRFDPAKCKGATFRRESANDETAGGDDGRLCS